jgi:hypothetical protein
MTTPMSMKQASASHRRTTPYLALCDIPAADCVSLSVNPADRQPSQAPSTQSDMAGE